MPESPLSMCLVLVPLAFVLCAIRPDLDPITMPHASRAIVQLISSYRLCALRVALRKTLARWGRGVALVVIHVLLMAVELVLVLLVALRLCH